MLTTCLIGDYLCLVAFTYFACINGKDEKTSIWLLSELFVAHEQLRAAMSPSAAVPLWDGLHTIGSLDRPFMHCTTSSVLGKISRSLRNFCSRVGYRAQRIICNFRGNGAESQHEKPNIRRKQRVSELRTPYFRLICLPEIAVHLTLTPFTFFGKANMNLVVLIALSAGISSTDRIPFKIFLVIVDPKQLILICSASRLHSLTKS